MTHTHPLKQLSAIEGVQAACILFECNTEPVQMRALMREAGLLDADADANTATALCLEWCAFVHATIAAGLMLCAPNVVLVEYLRQTKTLLGAHGLGPEQCDAFVDTIFSPYMALLGAGQQRECPALFFKRVYDCERLEDAPRHALARISVVMALTVSTVFDALERYTIQADTMIPTMPILREGHA